jgi:hypothetical protein
MNVASRTGISLLSALLVTAGAAAQPNTTLWQSKSATRLRVLPACKGFSITTGRPRPFHPTSVWLNRSGTGFFLVYNDRRDTSSFTPDEVLGRSFVVKYTRLFT